MAFLLDVNILIALVDSDHVHHAMAQSWFGNHHQSGWATCPLTENGMVRVLSQPTYPSGQRTPAEVIEILGALRSAFRPSHEFWPDDLSLTDDSVFDRAMLAGARQVTDAYLLGMVARRAGSSLVSFDRALPWQAAQGGSPGLVHQLALSKI